MNHSSVTTAESPSSYGIRRVLEVGYQDAIARTRAALQKEGFGVLFEIDMKEKLQEKLGVAFRNYVILGACNPPMAYQTLQEEIEIGLLLPCNVIVYEEGGKSVVAAIDAARMMTVVGNPKLAAGAQEINDRLQRVIESL